MGDNAVTITADDGNGNTDSQNITVTVQDTLSPSLAVQDITVQLDGSGTASIAAKDLVTSASDNCGIQDTTVSPSSFDCTSVGLQQVTVTLTDIYGNTTSKTAYVTVEDTIAPDLAVQDVTVYLNEQGEATLAPSQVVTSASDNCEIKDTTLSRSTFTCADIANSPVTVTVTLTDVNGNSTQQDVLVTVADNLDPTLTVNNSNPVLYLDANGEATLNVSDIASATDNCGTPTITASQTVFTCANVGDNAVTITADDGNGNTDFQNITVTVVDTLPPVISVSNSNPVVYLDENGQASILIDTIASATDNCTSNPTLSADKTSFTCDDLGDNIITITATDALGNVSQISITVTVKDGVPPVITINQQNPVLQLDANGNATLDLTSVASADDNCSVLSFTASKTTFDCTNLGDNGVILTAIDFSNNITNDTIVVTVIDNIAPDLNVVNNTTIYLDANGIATLNVSEVASATDNCGNPTLSASQTDFTCDNLGDNIVTITADDGNGNIATGQITVTVEDTLPPVISVRSSNPVVYLDQNGQASILIDTIASATDNCTANPTLTADKTSFTCDNLGDNIITLTATDAQGNTSTTTVTVTVKDNTSPEITIIHSNPVVSLDSNGTGSLDINSVASASDNCSVSSFVADKTNFSCSDLGNVTVTLSATDISGNTSTVTIDVTVQDNIAPVITINNDNPVLQLDANGTATLDINSVASAYDNCGVESFTADKTTFTCNDLGDNVITLSAIDASGNVKTATLTVTVEDNTPPAITVTDINPILYLDANGTATLDVNSVATASDNCNDVSLIADQTVFTCDNLGDNSVTLTAQDLSGNTATEIITVTVRDTLPPTILITEPNPVVYLDENGQATLDVNSIATAVDNCSGVTLSADKTDFSCNDLGDVVVTIIATDASGNSSTEPINVSIRDTLAPVITVNDNVVIYLDENGLASIDVNDVASATDNCTVNPTLSADKTDFTCGDLGDNIITITAEDLSGNVATQTITVTVEDTIAPVITSTLTDMVVEADSSTCTYILPDFTGEVTVFDNCTSDTLIVVEQNPVAGTELHAGDTITVMVNATDDQNNTSSIEFSIAVIDIYAPVITCRADTVLQANNTQGYLVEGTDFDPDVFDCTGITLVNDFNDSTSLDGAILPVGSTTITWFATDIFGNSDTCSYVITVEEYTLVRDLSASIKVYPNPADDKIFIELDEQFATANVEIIDMTGRVVMRRELKTNNGYIVINNLESGVYTLRVSLSDKVMTTRIIKR